MEHEQVAYYNFFAVTTTTVGILLLLIFFFCGLIFISERVKHTKTQLFAWTLTDFPTLLPEKCLHDIEQPHSFATQGFAAGDSSLSTPCPLLLCLWTLCRRGCHGVIRPGHLSKLWRTPALCFGTLFHGHLVLVLLSGWFQQASHVSPHHSFIPGVEKDKKTFYDKKKITIMGNTISSFRCLCVNVWKLAMIFKRYFKLATFYFLHLWCELFCLHISSQSCWKSHFMDASPPSFCHCLILYCLIQGENHTEICTKFHLYVLDAYTSWMLWVSIF